MPWLDVNEVLSDPYLADTFSVIRRQQSVDQHGEPQITIVGVANAAGVVTPTGDNSLVRQDAYEMGTQSVKIITAFRLHGAARDALGQEWLPDLIQWSGGTYIVKTMNDYLRFGAGFSEVDCIAFDFDLPAEYALPPGTAPSLDFTVSDNSGQRLLGWA